MEQTLLNPAVDDPKPKAAHLTFAALVRLEPRLGKLLADAKAMKAPRGFCANRVWYGRFKARLSRLVGWERIGGHPALSTMEAYDVAYETIYDALPNCRHASGLC